MSQDRLDKTFDVLVDNDIIDKEELSANIKENLRYTPRPYQIEAFVEVARFKNLMDEFLSTLKGTPTAPGYERVLFPGQLEWETYQIRKKQGIPLHKEVIQWFSDICQELGIDNTL